MLTPESAIPPLPPSESASGALLRRLAGLVLDEAETARAQAHGIWARPLAERVAAGRAIDEVRIGRRQPDGLLTLTCRRNESRFREGDVLVLSRQSPFDEPAFLVTLESDDETELLVSSEDPDLWRSEAFADPDGWVLDEGFLDFSQMMLDALAEAGDSAVGREQVLPLLTGVRRPQFDLAHYESACERAAGWGLNDEQREALAWAYATNLAYLIQGPPGTGKTVVLARLAQLLAEDGERVLVTAFTHRAINNALNKLVDLIARDAAPLTAAKIGPPARRDDLHAEAYEDFATSPLAELNGGYVIGATPFATRTRRLDGVDFDTVIFDEASQITLPLAMMGMLRARRFVFIGDQCQLPPVLATRVGDRLLRDSIFGALVDQGFDQMLEITYRLNDPLAAWPSAQFYDHRLRPSSEAATRRMQYPRPPAHLADLLDPEEPKVFVDLGHRAATSRNLAEARLAVDLIIVLLDCGVPPGEIGVVAPYRAQGRAIRSLLRWALRDQPDVRRAIVVDTVERMQGQERDLVIVSLTTSDPVYASDLADFVFQPERLNVAITRPRRKLIVLGSRHMLDAMPAAPEQREAVALLRDLLASCVYHSAPE